MLKLGVIDEIIPEPRGGAQRDRHTTIKAVGVALERAVAALAGKPGADLVAARRRKFLNMGKKGLAA